jgi:hypothetical protein
VRLHRIRFAALALLMILFWVSWGSAEPRSATEAWTNRALFAGSIVVLVVGGLTTKPR